MFIELCFYYMKYDQLVSVQILNNQSIDQIYVFTLLSLLEEHENDAFSLSTSFELKTSTLTRTMKQPACNAVQT